MVNIDHTKAFQESMDTCGIWNGVAEFDTIAFAIAFYKSTCNTCLIVTKSSTSNY